MFKIIAFRSPKYIHRYVFKNLNGAKSDNTDFCFRSDTRINYSINSRKFVNT